MALTIEQLTQWQLAATPINYAVCYEYNSQKNPALSSSIHNQINDKKTIDNFFIEEVYKAHVLGQSKFRESMVVELDNVLRNLLKNSATSCAATKDFIHQLEHSIANLESVQDPIVHSEIQAICSASSAFADTQSKLQLQLTQSHQQSESLRQELKEIRKEIDLDPVTGLYNRKAISQHIEQWQSQDPNKRIAVIIINVDQLSDFSQRFGDLLGDVILSKIANKISSYVKNSGIPVRTGGDEFLILLPEMDESNAIEIADKINIGVQKLRFVSVQTGVRLPKLAISLGVSAGQLNEPIEQCIDKAKASILPKK